MTAELIADLRVSPDDFRGRPNDPGHPSVHAFAHGSLEVRWFRPTPGVQHLPHDRDEVYFVVSGAASFRRGNDAGAFEEDGLGLAGQQEVSVAAGDVLFVPAGSPHEFYDTSADFGVWAVFYGPEGGELP